MLEAFVFQNLFQTTLKGQVQVEVQLQEEVMETSDPVKHKSNDTVGFFFPVEDGIFYQMFTYHLETCLT